MFISVEGFISPGKNIDSRHVLLLRVRQMPNISLYWQWNMNWGHLLAVRRVRLGRGFERCGKSLEITHRKLKENLTSQRGLGGPVKVGGKLEITLLFLFSISPSQISLCNSNFPLTSFPTKWMKMVTVLSLPKWQRKHCTPSILLDIDVEASQDLADPATMCKSLQITW